MKAKPVVDLLYSAFCTGEPPKVRKLAKKHGFPLREYDIWDLDAGDISLPPYIRRKIEKVRSGEEGFFAGACFIDGKEIDWWAGFEQDFASAGEKAHG